MDRSRRADSSSSGGAGQQICGVSIGECRHRSRPVGESQHDITRRQRRHSPAETPFDLSLSSPPECYRQRQCRNHRNSHNAIHESRRTGGCFMGKSKSDRAAVGLQPSYAASYTTRSVRATLTVTATQLSRLLL
mgnify:CR=1 FL=1